MCDRIKEDDERNVKIKTMLNDSGCSNANLDLDNCLKNSKRDWRKCQV